MSTVISFKNVTKRYYLFDSPFQRLKSFFRKNPNEKITNIEALKDVSFDIKAGQTFGIIGRNGSGKSTALSIMAGILTPTSGSVYVKGKVSALLELGSGFNPEFTGIDNVYLYGSILGLSENEIDMRFDRILEFSEIGDFIYKPVKFYSSGMMLRLAFSVAISVDADIIIIDEALAVGDALFQHKCVQKIKSLIEAGTTIIFVSHDFAIVKNLCEEVVLLDKGQVVAQGKSEEVVNEYHRILFEEDTAENLRDSSAKKTVITSNQKKVNPSLIKSDSRFGTGEAKFIDIKVLNSRNELTEIFSYAEEVNIELEVEFYENVDEPCVGLIIRSSKGIDVITATSDDFEESFVNYKAGDIAILKFSFIIELAPDDYSISAAIINKENVGKMAHYDWVQNVCLLRVSEDQRNKFFGVYFPKSLKLKVKKHSRKAMQQSMASKVGR